MPQNRCADSSVTSRQLNCAGRALANTRLIALPTILSVQWPQTITRIFAARKKKLQPAFRTLRSKLSPSKLEIHFQPGVHSSVSTPSDWGMRVPVCIKRAPTRRVFDIASFSLIPCNVGGLAGAQRTNETHRPYTPPLTSGPLLSVDGFELTHRGAT